MQIESKSDVNKLNIIELFTGRQKYQENLKKTDMHQQNPRLTKISMDSKILLLSLLCNSWILKSRSQ